jgi:acyl dehydratase
VNVDPDRAEPLSRPPGGPAFGPERLGRWSDATRFDVRPEQVAAYAAATNEPVRPYPEGAAAPPMFALLPAIDVYPQQVERLFGRTLASMGSVHGEHDLLIDQPVRSGTTVTTRVAVTGVQVKASGTAVVVQIESRGEDGALLNTQYAVQFLRGFDAGGSAGEVPPAWLVRDAARRERPPASMTLTVDPDQARRYAEASGDFGDYTLDDDAAHRAGFPRPILHGACTMALVGRAVTIACGGPGPARLRRLAVRFSAPCFPGDQLTTTIWELRDQVPQASLAFEVTDAEGRKVITNGIAEVSA